MKIKFAPYRLVLMALVAALWVLAPALPAQAHDGGNEPPGEWRLGEGDANSSDDRDGNTGGGGPNADPDTFEIDHRLGPDIGVVDGDNSPRGPQVAASFWFRFLDWLVIVIQDVNQIGSSAGH